MYNCHTLLQRQLEHQVNETRSIALLAKVRAFFIRFTALLSNKSSGLSAKQNVHSNLTLFVILNVVHNSKLWPLSFILSFIAVNCDLLFLIAWKGHKFLKNRPKLHYERHYEPQKAIPITWVKLVQNSFAINYRNCTSIICMCNCIAAFDGNLGTNGSNW